MTRAINRLTAKQVTNLQNPGRYSDGGNLYLSISKTGSRKWIFMYRFAGRQREMGLGSANTTGISLATAREFAAKARVLLNSGKDPIEAKREKQRKQRVIPSFGEWADDYIATHSPSWRNDKHIAQWKMTLTDYCASIRGLPVNEISTEMVLEVLKPIWTTRPETARRLRGRIENVLDAAKAIGLRNGENPARWKGHLQNLLPSHGKLSRGHHAALPYSEIPAFLDLLYSRNSTAARALELTILTACRTSEVLNARWEEFDLDKALWVIPAERTKTGREHRVPLSDKAIAILEALPRHRHNNHVFYGHKAQKPLSSMAMAMQLRRMDRNDITVHGFRSTFRDWASETTPFPRDVCEMALAHTIANKTEAAYRRGDLLAKRAELMQVWADYCYQHKHPNTGLILQQSQ